MKENFFILFLSLGFIFFLNRYQRHFIEKSKLKEKNKNLFFFGREKNSLLRLFISRSKISKP
jgi:hypothetical protein